MLTVHKERRRPHLPALLLAVVLTSAVSLSGCGETTHENAVKSEPAGLGAAQATVEAGSTAGAQTGSAAGTSSAGAQSGSTTGASTDSEAKDSGVAENSRTLVPRASVSTPAGILTLVSTGEETVEKVETASCLAAEGDTEIHGSYTLLLLPPGDAKPQEVQRLPELDIIAKTSDPLTLDTLTLAGHSVYLFTPRYTDCHSLEFYAYMTDYNGAYLMGFQMEDGSTPHTFQRSPVAKPVVENDRLVVKGGYAAGMNAVTLFRFRPDWSNHRFILDSTDQVKP